MAVRTFVALELPEALLEGILRLIHQLRDSGIRASWSGRGTLHVTLKFLGDVEERELPRVVEAVAAASAQVPPFSFETTRLGGFPSPRNPRVLWVGVTPVDELLELQEALETELAAIGFARERRRFHPHITVGRIRGRAPEATGEIISGLDAPRGTVDVTETRVMRSTLDPRGAIHELVKAVPLGGEKTDA
ncbi:MAG: RNA 2',3'-cyclic phosphodiesterase [Candidatus Eisenbacteria bacterium]|nr:RNA 2',3'-cyclic phosphodiesterase [Candidatus Eisenbacteria bacterium]